MRTLFVQPIRRGLAMAALLLAAGCALPGQAAGQAPALNLELTPAPLMDSSKFLYPYDAYEKNTIYVTVHGWNDRIFGMHLFEDMLVPWHADIRYKNNRRINADLFTWQREGEDWIGHIDQTESINFEATVRVRALDHAVRIEGEVTNRESFDWGEGGQALFCYRSRLAPDFRDDLGERIYLRERSTGEKKTVYEVAGTASSYFHYWVYHPDDRFMPVVEKWNQQERLGLRAWSEPAMGLLGNRSPGICCIHPNVRLNAARGQTVTFVSQLEFVDRQLNAAEDWTLY